MTDDLELQRCYRHPDRETGLACANCGRPICPDCMRMTPVGQRCPECRGKQQVIRPRAAGGATMPITTVLIVINVLVFVVVEQGLGGFGFSFRGVSSTAAAFDRWGFYGGYLQHGAEWYRLVTSLFIHISLIHLGFNMYFLYVIGPSIEARLGRARYLFVYFGAGLFGGLGSVVLQPHSLGGGASGALFGLMGATAVAIWKAGSRDLSQIGTLIAINLGFGFVVSGIGWGAHIGGLIGGAILMYLFETAGVQKRRVQAVVYAAALTVVVAGVAATYLIARARGL